MADLKPRDKRESRGRPGPQSSGGAEAGADIPRGAQPGARISRGWIVAGAVFLIGLIVRLAVYGQMRAWPLLQRTDVLADTRYYDMMARQVAAGDWIGNHPYFLSPAYYYALGLAYAIFGPGGATILGLQVVLGALSCALAYAIGRKVLGETAGRVAGLLLALYAYFAYHNLVLLPDSFILFLNLLALWVLVDLEERLSWKRALLAGVLIGVAAAGRANAVLLVPAAAVVVLLTKRFAQRERLIACAALAGGCLLVIAPMTLRNYVVSKEFVPLTTTSGRNLWKGNGPGATGAHRFLEEDDWGQGLQVYLSGNADPRTAVEDSRRLSAQAWSHMAAHPVATAGLWLKKLGLFFHSHEFGIRDQFYFSQQYSSLLRILPVAFGWIAPLGLVGLVTALRRRRGGMLAAALITQIASFTALFVLGRYRLVAAAILALFAAWQLVQWADELRKRDFRRFALTAAAAVVLIALGHLPLPAYPRDEGFADQYLALGQHYISSRDCAPAIDAFQKALVSDWLDQPYLENVRNNARYRIALCQLELGRLDEARATAAELLARLEADPAADARLVEVSRQLQQEIERVSGATTR